MDKNITTILALDPRIGIAVLSYDHNNKQFTVLHFHTLSTTKFNKEIKSTIDIFGKNLVFLEITKHYISETMNVYSPDVIVSEDAFHQARFVTAFRSLCNWICVVSLYLYENHKKLLNVLAPKKIKKIITNHDNASKEEMYEALLKLVENKEVVFKEDNYKDLLTEHTVDAICIGIAWIKK